MAKFVKVGRWKIPEAVLVPYVQHVVDRYNKAAWTRDMDLYKLELMRESLHEAVLEAIGMTRVKNDYHEFEIAMETYIDKQLPQEPQPEVHQLITPSTSDIIRRFREGGE